MATERLSSCPTDGRCRELMFDKHGIDKRGLDFGPGTKTALKDEPVFSELRYKCCSDCHLPVNQQEAARINRWLGVSASEIVLELDDDFLNALEKAFDG